MPSMKDIKPFTTDGHYNVTADLAHLVDNIKRYQTEYDLQLNPDFQRGHVWTEAQQIAFVEYILKGGITNPIRLNHEGWMKSFEGEFVCVDGLQRITALLRFLNNEIKAFGRYLNEYEDTHVLNRLYIDIRINDLKTREEVLKWYLELNEGGTPHSQEELDRVRNMLKKD